MSREGQFNIPESAWQSTRGAREAYARMWGREWPHDDDYLRQLAREVPPGEPGFSRCTFLLELMRENHAFEPDPQPAPDQLTES
jgi:hypothetical protein